MRTSKKERFLWLAERAALIACALLFMPITAAAFDSECRARVELRLDDEVANPRDPSFVTSLTGNPMYRLVWVKGKDSVHVFDLIGPGNDLLCHDGIDLLRRDAAILDLRVIDPD